MSFWVIAAAVIIGSLVYKIVFGTTCENVEMLWCRVSHMSILAMSHNIVSEQVWHGSGQVSFDRC